MPRMLPGIENVEQHRVLLEGNPDAYKPERCPHCGKAGLHHHGHYERNAPRGEGLALALGWVIILRFFPRRAGALARACPRFCHHGASIGGRASKRCWKG